MYYYFLCVSIYSMGVARGHFFKNLVGLQALLLQPQIIIVDKVNAVFTGRRLP